MGTTDQNYATLGPGLGGFLLTFFLAAALVLLVRSMVGHLRKVRYSPDPAAEPDESEPNEPDPKAEADRPEGG